MEAGWEFSTGSEQQAWEWNVQAEESYFTPWCDSHQEDPACWNRQQADSLMPEYMPVLELQADSQMPEYIPGVGVAEDAPATPGGVVKMRTTGPLLSPLPPGVEVAVDLEPPPLSPGAPGSPITP